VTSKPCELCGHTGEMSPMYPRRRIVRCPFCALIFYDARVDTASLYGDEYFRGGEYFDYVADRKVIQWNARKRIDRLRRLVRPGGRLLEIGSAYGFFLELAREHWRVRGIDVTPGGVQYSRDVLGLDVAQADFLDLPEEPESFDAICMWDTVEHLPHPVRFIEKAARWLKPGGVLVMSTGDAGSLVARIRGERWRQIHPPTHLYYFSRGTLTQAVKQAGLEPVEISSEGVYRSYRSMAYGVFALGGKRTTWAYRIVTFGEKLDFPVYLNLYDLFVLVAKK
jgi:SAM-dependent methyltransferase